MSVNKVIIIGYLTSDVSVKEEGQWKIASFSVATTEKYKKKTGEYTESTEYHNCSLFGNEWIHPYLRKGQMVYVEGSLKTDSWKDKSGTTKYMTRIRVQNIQLIGGKPQNSDGGQRPQPQQTEQRRAYRDDPETSQYTSGNRNFPSNQRVDDDLPI